MLDDYIDDNEFLYRRVILNPNYWDFESNKPTSAIFKDSNGVSVDRQWNRNDSEIIEGFKVFEIRAVVKILTATCRDLEANPVYKPVESNIFHSEIHDSIHKVQISGSKAKRLRDSSQIIYVTSE